MITYRLQRSKPVSSARGIPEELVVTLVPRGALEALRARPGSWHPYAPDAVTVTGQNTLSSLGRTGSSCTRLPFQPAGSKRKSLCAFEVRLLETLVFQ